MKWNFDFKETTESGFIVPVRTAEEEDEKEEANRATHFLGKFSALLSIFLMVLLTIASRKAVVQPCSCLEMGALISHSHSLAVSPRSI